MHQMHLQDLHCCKNKKLPFVLGGKNIECKQNQTSQDYLVFQKYFITMFVSCLQHIPLLFVKHHHNQHFLLNDGFWHYRHRGTVQELAEPCEVLISIDLNVLDKRNITTVVAYDGGKINVGTISYTCVRGSFMTRLVMEYALHFSASAIIHKHTASTKFTLSASEGCL